MDRWTEGETDRLFSLIPETILIENDVCKQADGGKAGYKYGKCNFR